MSADSLLRNVQGISNDVQGTVDILGRLTGGSFWSQLRPASFRGISFGVMTGQGRFGRRNAVHEYPFRDVPWVEDLGRQARRIQVGGFLVGDDVIAQRKRVIDACEKAGDGELVHPTLGRMTVALIDVSFSEHWQQGRVFEVHFTFIEQGQRLYPETTTTTADTVNSGATGLDSAASANFVTRAINSLKFGAAVAQKAAVEASAWSKIAIQAGNDATSLIKLAVTLPGEFGRLLGQASGVTVGQVVPTIAGLTAQGLTGKAAVSRETVANAVASLSAASTQLSVTSAQPFADAGQGLCAAVLDAGPTPGDALRGLAAMADYAPAPSGTGVFLALQQAALDVFRRAAVASMARAAANYEPASSDDAAAVRTDVLARLDAQITRAGDQGDDDVYTSLRSLRASVVKDLNAKGATAPTLKQVSTGACIPSLTLAQRLYRDPTREAELVSRANPMHPAFMPVSFKALAS